MLSKIFDSRKTLALILTLVFAIITIAINPKTTFTASAESLSANATCDQNVYSGPSNELYGTQGWIAKDEAITVIGQEGGWYHIVYKTTGNYTKSGYVPFSGVKNLPSTPHEEDFYGGYCISNSSQIVYYSDNVNYRTQLGSISANEGVTRLYEYNSNGHTILFIEYSTSGKAKRGYIIDPNFSYPTNTCVARVLSTSDVYYGSYKDLSFWETGTYFSKAGTVYSGEYVSVVGKNGDNVYVEYNTSSGRKRGTMSASKLKLYHAPGSFDADIPFYKCNWIGLTSGEQTVYGGPGSGYAVIGSVKNEEIRYQNNGAYNYKYNGYILIQYKVNGSNAIKTGYVYAPNW